jgi:RNAse (barnase) inhibitor barstar
MTQQVDPGNAMTTRSRRSDRGWSKRFRSLKTTAPSLSVALNHHAYRSPAEDTVGAEYELDGRQVVDENSFYCALGEAVNGPGGYFGWNLDALVDCLRGSWGARPPFALHWRRSDIARLHLLEHRPTATGSAPLLELLLEILHGGGVDVVMC